MTNGANKASGKRLQSKPDDSANLSPTPLISQNGAGRKKACYFFCSSRRGAEDFIIEEKVLDEKNQTRPFHINVVAPEKLAGQKDLIERVIEFEKPVHVTYELEFAAGD